MQTNSSRFRGKIVLKKEFDAAIIRGSENSTRIGVKVGDLSDTGWDFKRKKKLFAVLKY